LLIRPIIEMEWNRQLLAAIDAFRPDLVYITNADLCWPRTVQKIRDQSIPIMCFYHDVQWKDRPGSRFSQNIAYFDLVATTRHWQEAEFKQAGARAVCVTRFGYEPMADRPMPVSAATAARYGADVTFVGTHEPFRARQLDELLTRDPVYSFRLWGGLWDRLPDNSPARRYWQGRTVYEQEVALIYASSRIALHWVGWEPDGSDAAMQKGDQHNSRTFRIAACGGAMMLAQRTDEHCRYFAEDREAVFFTGVPELREKLGYWLDPARDKSRRCLAAAARERCLKEDYSFVPVARNFLKHFGLID
jgi:spore maturation protein CgeB